MKLVLALCPFLFLVVTFFPLGAVKSESVDGFVSLDCGLEPKDATTFDSGTQLTYMSDLNFIDTGESRSVKKGYEIPASESLWRLRYFPDGIRNCYNLKLTKGKTYLVRASFMYGDYDSKNKLPKFDLFIGPHLWSHVVLNKHQWWNMELIHVLTSSTLQVCLHKSEETAPIISSLEVRPLIDQYNASKGSLKNVGRWFFTTKDGKKWIRYPEDTLDRGWYGWYNEDWSLVSTQSNIDMGVSNYQVPQSVMKTAATPKNPNQPINITFSVDNPNSNYLFYMHFADIEPQSRNETRNFSIHINGFIWQPDFIPYSFQIFTLYSDTPSKPINSKFEIIYTRIGNSTRPPLLNALEVYELLTFSGSETDENEVEALNQMKSYYGIKRISWQGDPCAPQDLKWDGVDCSSSDSPRIISLNLSSSGLKREISRSVRDLRKLQSLDMSDNKLTGTIPAFLGAMKELTFINLNSNMLDASIPQALRVKLEEGSLTLLIENNKRRCNKKNIILIVAAAAATAVLFAFVLIVYIYMKKKRRNVTLGRQPSEAAYGRSGIVLGPPIKTNDRRFSYPDILKITNNFETRLATGGFGTVYLGYLNHTDPVAVKMLSQSSMQGYKEFKAEVEVLLRVHHKNLVTLVGYCDHGDKLALIYEYMANGDLQAHLLAGKQGRKALSWKTRLEISLQVAQGLEYLHIGCNPPMIHRDVKTKNILLNEKLEAKLGDFGLARSFSDDHVSTVIVGTPGYVDPEYYKTNQLTVKSDIYSFGIVLLEIITNQPVISKAYNDKHIVDWMKHNLEIGDIQQIIDPNLLGDFDEKSAWYALELAMMCVEDSVSSRRPSITYILHALNESLSIESERLKNVSKDV